MRKALATLNKLLHPPKWVLFCVPSIVFAVLIAIFYKGKNNSSQAYPIYCMSVYCLLIWVLPLPKLLKVAKENVMCRVTDMAIGRKYVDDLAFHGSVSIYQGIFIMHSLRIRIAVGSQRVI